MALTRREVVRTMRMPARSAARLSDVLYRAKAREYRETLLTLSRRFGEPRSRVLLSPEIRAALRKEARDHASSIIRTTNRAIETEARRRNDLPPYLLARHLQGFVGDRTRRRSGLIARQEAATARLDAEVSFFRENGIDPRFDFIGPVAKCPVCKRLKTGGPWSIDVVVRIGQPHIGCTHHWKARAYSAAKLRAGGLRPKRISAGRGRIAGIVGGAPLMHRHGTTEEALAYLDGVAA